MKKISILLSITIAFFIGFTACDLTDDDDSTGTMEVSMTDAPANYEAVTITVNDVRVHQDANAETDGEESDDEAEENGWVSIMNESMEVDLLELTNGNQAILGSAELEAGNYSQIRLILGDNNSVTVDGETYNLQTPSAQQSGLKLNVDAEVEEGETYSLLIDFDAARSIVQQGNGGYLLQPVLRSVNLTESGSIAGNVQPSDFNTHVLAVTNGDTTASTITAENGDFQIIGLPAESTYEVVYHPSSDEYADSTQTNIDVTQGAETNLGTIELEPNQQ